LSPGKEFIPSRLQPSRFLVIPYRRLGLKYNVPAVIIAKVTLGCSRLLLNAGILFDSVIHKTAT